MKIKKNFLYITILLILLAYLLSCGDSSVPGVRSATVKTPAKTPADFKVAIFGDLGLDKNSNKLLQLVKSEGTEMVLHLGDIDYGDDPAAHFKRIDSIFGPDFPYLMLVGNHDEKNWYGEGGYQAPQEKRLRRIGVEWEGDLGVKSTVRYKGLSIIMASPGITGSNFFKDVHASYIKDSFEGDRAIWKICAWHKNQHRMQVSRKADETNWRVYEECRKAGAFVTTGHSHTYSRTHLLKSVKNQRVASRSDNLELERGRKLCRSLRSWRRGVRLPRPKSHFPCKAGNRPTIGGRVSIRRTRGPETARSFVNSINQVSLVTHFAILKISTAWS